MKCMMMECCRDETMRELWLSRLWCPGFLNTVYCDPAVFCLLHNCVFCHVRSRTINSTRMLPMSGLRMSSMSWRVAWSHQQMMMKTVRHLSSVRMLNNDLKMLKPSETKHIPCRTCFHPGVSGMSLRVKIQNIWHHCTFLLQGLARDSVGLPTEKKVTGGDMIKVLWGSSQS